MAITFVHSTHNSETQTAWVLSHVLRIYRNVIAIFLGTAVVITLLMSIFSITAPKNSVGPSVLGRQLLVVRSGSMGPVFDTGSLIGITKVSGAEAMSIPAGEIVTFRSLANPDILITHRIVNQLTAGDTGSAAATAQYITKGDANATEDGTILDSSRIVGRYSFEIPRGGYIMLAIEGGRLLASFALAFIFASIALMLTEWIEGSKNTKEIQ